MTKTLGRLHKKSEEKMKKEGRAWEKGENLPPPPPPPDEGITLLRRVLRLRPLVLLIEIVLK
jgi:hypothetical protein